MCVRERVCVHVCVSVYVNVCVSVCVSVGVNTGVGVEEREKDVYIYIERQENEYDYNERYSVLLICRARTSDRVAWMKIIDGSTTLT